MNKTEASHPQYRETHTKFSVCLVSLTNAVLPGWDRPWGKLSKSILSLWSLWKTALFLIPPCLSFHLQCNCKAPHEWNKEVSQQGYSISPHIHYWCLQAVQNSPKQMFRSLLCTVPPCFSSGGAAILHRFPIGWWGGCLYISLTTLICPWETCNIWKGSESFNQCYLSGPLWGTVFPI